MCGSEQEPTAKRYAVEIFADSPRNVELHIQAEHGRKNNSKKTKPQVCLAQQPAMVVSRITARVRTTGAALLLLRPYQ